MKIIKIYDKEYPIEFTVEAQKAITDKAGEGVNIGEFISNNTFFALATMMSAARHRAEVFFKSDKSPEPLTEEELEKVFLPNEYRVAVKTMFEVINESFKSDVETVPEKPGKKTKAIESK